MQWSETGRTMDELKPSEPVVEVPRRWIPVASAVWLVPIVALAIALGVAWRSYSDRGPLIEILFDSASGIVAGETTVRYKDFAIGMVEDVRFTDDLSQVVVSARLHKDAARHVDSNTKFWLVRAQVGPRGISGLETVLSGAFIGAELGDAPGAPQDHFTALSAPPLTPAGQPGLRIRLSAPDGGSLSVGAPILFKQIPVGKIEAVELTEAGDVMVTAFVDAPNDRRLTSATRFWNASGFSIELGTGGASLNVESLAALVQGGITFDTVTSGGEPIESGHLYRLYANEKTARNVILNDDPAELLRVMTFFEGSVRGLQTGAPVEYLGITVGEVTELQSEVVRVDDRPVVRVRAVLTLNPARVGLPSDGDMREEALDLLADAVQRGVRARLASANILTGSLFVEFAEIPDAEPATLGRDAEPFPEVPSVATPSGSLAASAEGVLDRVQSLPVEEVMNSVITLLGNANRLITDERVRKAPENLGLLLADLRALVGSEAVQQAPQDLAATLASARALLDGFAERQLAEEIATTLQSATATLDSITVAAEGVPAMLEDVGALSDRARELPLEDIVASATTLIDDVNALVRSDEVAAIPPAVTDALAELRGLIADLRDGGTIENVNATLVSVRAVSDDIAAARLGESLKATLASAEATAAQVSTASEDLPELIENLTTLSQRMESLPLDELVASGTRVLGTFDTFLASEGVESVPPRLAASLEELRLILAELREGGAVANVNATLASADEAAAAITSAAADLPALVAQFSRVADQADAALAQIGPGSDVNRETLMLLREVRDAAKSVTALVTALERRPNSVLFGR